ncbi:hypothetical protein Enr13x_19620 [Stieleria neptunia]|uniref:Uncharacterized protein n=1 Tax=Stieleria neptunia TaxID=2527979 RepID=A0A518HMT0_9BACT|nr:hypothetical protein [Stieleria neptunia]QDV42119.1 hypothetical protein Enr13x_19620 [Stieleria neptunia]
MAKQTEDREDLLRDGTAMPVRGRLWVDRTDVVIGFRSRGQLSLYWDQDPVFQFDESCRLRRVFIDSCRLKAQNRNLVRLRQPHESINRSVERLRLLTEPISQDDQAAILQRLSGCLQQIDATLEQMVFDGNPARLQTVGATPPEFARRVRGWIADWKQSMGVAGEPSA